MKCLSTRGQSSASLADAITQGLAPDGGLYVPERLPSRDFDFPTDETIAQVAMQLLAPFFEAEEKLERALAVICERALDFAAPIEKLRDDVHLLELFHGPTCAFKDFGARFLAEVCTALAPAQPLTILVATSGDTGAAVAAAFNERPGFRVIVLYPDGRVSPRQAHQLGAFGNNVTTYAVNGSFDDCQRMVKSAFAAQTRGELSGFTSANSISLGRLLPQMAYYAHAVTALHRTSARPVTVVVPTGNLGNAVACLMVKLMGAPIHEVVLATNENRVLPDYFASGTYTPRPSVSTLANAMDVGAPSNFERLRFWFPDARKTPVRAISISDEQITQTLLDTWNTHRRAVCPHTACAIAAERSLHATTFQDNPWLIAATAHPAKFEGVVEPLIHTRVPVPEQLAQLLARPSKAHPLEANDAAFIEHLKQLHTA